MRRSVPLVLFSITLSILATVLASVGARVVREARSCPEGQAPSRVPA